MQALLTKLQADYPSISFVEGEYFYWSPKNNVITYCAKDTENQEVTLLHELAHAALEHASFKTDYSLLLLEVEAWEKAKQLGEVYGVSISETHIQDCLDTYRDWLHIRSTCPGCANNGLQDKETSIYSCPNCSNKWRVSTSRLCRPYRKSVQNKKAQRA